MIVCSGQPPAFLCRLVWIDRRQRFVGHLPSWVVGRTYSPCFFQFPYLRRVFRSYLGSSHPVFRLVSSLWHLSYRPFCRLILLRNRASLAAHSWRCRA